MLLIYVPSAIFLSSYLLPFYSAFSAGDLTGSLLNMGSISGALVSNGRECLVATMLFGHFAKRILETLFLHKYSSKETDGTMGGFIGFYYMLTCLLITNFSVRIILLYFLTVVYFLLFYFLKLLQRFSNIPDCYQLNFSLTFCVSSVSYYAGICAAIHAIS